MVKHLSFTEFDMAAVTNTVNRYKSAGLNANYNLDQRDRGIVAIAFENPVHRDGSTVLFEIHKLARKGWLREKAHWVVQIYSQNAGESDFAKHGCSFGSTQVVAISDAEQDVRYGFTSVLDFELAASTD